MTTLPTWLQPHHIETMLRVAILLGLGLPLIRLVSVMVKRFLAKHFSPQEALLTQKAILYGGSTLLVLMSLHELGFNLTTLLGAAGIAGVAIGFASQTSLSNLISGLFLIWERPFEVGDVIKVEEETGTVHSIDLLSVQIRSFDNKLVRIPNENLLKTQFTTVTRFPIRRMDIDIGVAYKEDTRRVCQILAEVADRNPYCLDEPAPLILFKGFGESSIDILMGVWFAKADYLQLRNSILHEIKERFEEEGIEIPFPHRTLYAGAATGPMPIRITQDEAAAEPAGPAT